MTQYCIPPWRIVVRIGAVAPLALVLPFTGDGTFDYTTVATADIFFDKPNGQSLQFVGVTISGKTTTGLTLTHVWQAGDVDQLGKCKARARFYIPAVGQIDTDPQVVDVVGLDDLVLRNQP